MGIAAKIQALVPRVHSKFKKLKRGKDPYHFLCWANDTQGKYCLKYWFWDKKKHSQNKKRVPLAEIIAAAKMCRTQGMFDRHTFQVHCPVSASDGSCGFAVIGRCLEFLNIAKYAGPGKGFR
jgi:hypothetical protein